MFFNEHRHSLTGLPYIEKAKPNLYVSNNKFEKSLAIF